MNIENKNLVVRVRFAPSPTGHLHIGNLRTAIFNYIFVTQQRGKFFLRIEDTDRLRSDKIYEIEILQILKWMNMDFEDPIIYQSQQQTYHKKTAILLYKLGYAFYCQQNSLIDNKRSADRDKNLSSGVLRFKVPENIDLQINDNGKINIVNSDQIEDFALLRLDGTPTYHLSVVCDDISLNITHIIRGNDHRINSFKQLLIYQALNYPMPTLILLPMINTIDNKKMSKRSEGAIVQKLKEEGIHPQALFNFLIRMGWGFKDMEIFSKEQMLEYFNIKNITPSSARFDIKRLYKLSGKYINYKFNLIAIKDNIKIFRQFIKEQYNQELAEDILLLMWHELSQKGQNFNQLYNMIYFIFHKKQFNITEIMNILNNQEEILNKSYQCPNYQKKIRQILSQSDNGFTVALLLKIWQKII